MSSSSVSTSARTRPADENDGRWVVAFLVLEIVCQILLVAFGDTPARVVLRSAAFGCSLAMVFVITRRDQPGHPAVLAAALACGFVALGFLSPERNTMLSAAATVGMYLAIVAPLYWAGRLRMNVTWLRRAVIVLWAFSSLSALAGVGQTLQPGWTWLQPNLSAVIQNHNDGGETLKISLASGAQVLRPMGLSDQPGAAAMAGLVCVVFGVCLFVVYERSLLMQIACGASMTMGIFCIYLSQVRSVLVMTGVCVIAFVVIMVRRGEFARLTRVLMLLGVVVVVATVWAVVIGGETVTERLYTLVAEDPREVYYQNRGHFLERTFYYLLPKYPFGAGPGRWGMMNHYFGTQGDPKSDVLWAEIQWTGWTYDGGVPLMFFYTLAIGIALWQAWKIGLRRDFGQIGLFGAMVFAFNIGCLAVTFNYPFFMGQGGMDFWVLNAALWSTAMTAQKRIAATAPRVIAAPSPLPQSLLGMHS